MGKELNKNQIGLTVGSTFGIMHLLWVIVVGFGFGQALIDRFQSMHFLSPVHTVGSFSLGTALIGIITAFVMGYLVGLLFAVLWNLISKKVK